MFDSRLPISYYKELAALDKAHGVFVVQHRETGRIYLKKVMSVYNPDVFEALFRNPIPFIPRIYAMYEAEHVLTIIEEYVPGDSLQELLELCGAFSPEEVVSYAVQLCDILTALHGMEPVIVHRDIKPSNVMITEEGNIFLIDLNAARLLTSEKSRDTRLLGTEGFAAPEQFGFGASSPLTDVYAMGTLMQALLGLRSAAPCDPGPGLSPIPRGLLRIIEKCLELNPKDRYPSAALLKKELQKLRL